MELCSRETTCFKTPIGFIYIYIYISSLVCGKEFSSQRNDLTMRLVKIISGATVNWIVVEGGEGREVWSSRYSSFGYYIGILTWVVSLEEEEENLSK